MMYFLSDYAALGLFGVVLIGSLVVMAFTPNAPTREQQMIAHVAAGNSEVWGVVR